MSDDQSHTKTPPLDQTSTSAGFTTFARIRDGAMALLRKYTEDEVAIHAMSLTYTTILSLVPLLAVTVSVLKGFGVQNQLEPLLANSLAPLGPQGKDISDQIIGFVNNLELGVLGAAGIAGLLYTVVSTVGAIENALNKVWHARESRPMAIKFRDYLSVVLIGPPVVFTALGLTATAGSNTIVQTVVETAPVLLWLGTVLLPNLILGIAFTLLYKFLPNTYVTWKAAAVGGFFAGIAWKIAGTAFTNFVVTSGQYSAIYQGFAIILLFFIWIYFNWLIVLVGGEIAYFVQHPASVLGAAREKTIIAREERGLMVAIALAEAHRRGDPPLTTWQLADRAGLSQPRVDEIIEGMIEHGLVLASERPAGVSIARDLSTISVIDVLDVVRGVDQEEEVETPEPVRDALQRRRNAVEQELRSTTLRELVA